MIDGVADDSQHKFISIKKAYSDARRESEEKDIAIQSKKE
jgi:hypothetical protein